ncbi:MAG TPA: hypothetical protein VKC89_00285 [Patescibacteria group bacterium]|nr:hypothetical protein [Patescibacteria group bacterium]
MSLNRGIINPLQQISLHKCFQCGSDLILVSEKKETMEGSRFPQTTSIYRCPNTACQEEKDRETAKRIKLKNQRLADTKKRLKLKLKKKN